MKICITGHRPNSFLISHYTPEMIIRMANDMVYVLKREFDNELFFNLGGAVGADQWVGNACIENKVPYKLYLPYHPSIQAKYWTKEQRKVLDDQLKNASAIEILEPDINSKYSPHIYMERNKRMVDDGNLVMAFWTGRRKGGTYHAISYALKQSKLVLNVLDKNRLILKNDLENGWTPPFLRGNDEE